MTDPRPRRQAFARSGAGAASALAAAIAFLVLIGWALGIPALMRVVPGGPAMAPNTALGFLLASASLWLQARHPGRWRVAASQACAGTTALLGLATLWEYARHEDLGIDQILFRDPSVVTGTLFPGRMAVVTAVCFLLMGAALLLSSRRQAGIASELLALVPGVLGLVFLTGYTFGVASSDWAGPSQGMAINTALAFFLLSAGTLLVRPDRGFARLISSDTAGGVVTRRILPVALAAPIVLGWLTLAGQREGLYGANLGGALYVVSTTAVVVAVLLGTAAALARADEGRRRTEEALQKAEEQYRLLFENSPLPMWVVDRETLRYLAANDAAVEHYGYSREEFLSMNIGQIRPAEDVAAVQRAIPKEKAGLEKMGVWRHLKKDGTLIYVDIATHTLTFAGRSAWLGLAYDVTDRLRAEETLRKLSRAVEQSPASIVITDLQGNIEYVNPKFTRATGYSSEEVVGKNPRILKSGEAPPDVYRDLWSTITAGREWQGEFHNRKKNGELFWEFASISPITNAEGTITHFIGIKEDITERKNLEEQLRQSQKMEAIGRLAGGIAHDFNNLLTAILGYSDLLGARLEGNEDALADLTEIRRAGERAAELTHQLLAFSRKQVLQPRLLDLNEVAAGMERILRRLIGEDIRLTLSLAPDLGPVRADPGQLEQVILNLAVNARDAMPEGGTLCLDTANVPPGDPSAPPPGPWVRLTVADTGVGMNEATKSQIFQPFFTTKEPGKGTGLGLATAYGIVQQSGGHITVESEPGRGARFRILFPRAEGIAGKTSGERPGARAAAGTRHALLVEDDGAVRRLVRATLEVHGWTVLEAASAEQALAAVEGRIATLDLVVSDVVMPGMNGREMAARLRAERPDLPILLMSGYTSDPTVRDGQPRPGTAFLQKPFTPHSLLDKVDEALRVRPKPE